MFYVYHIFWHIAHTHVDDDLVTDVVSATNEVMKNAIISIAIFKVKIKTDP